jgi:hypothetical protein
MSIRNSILPRDSLREEQGSPSSPQGMSRTTHFVLWSVIVLAILVRIPLLRYQ